MLMPFMPKEMYWKKILPWGILTLGLTLMVFWLFFQNQIGLIQSVGLWFRSFEFNAGIYYILRGLDALWRGYYNIHFVGPLTAVFAFIMIAISWIYYLKKPNIHWSAAMVYVLTIYFLLTTTLHPWYLGTILAISVISGHYYPVIWTYVVFLSYSHYSNGGFSEKYVFICIEYLLLFTWMIYESRFIRVSLLDVNDPLPPERGT